MQLVHLATLFCIAFLSGIRAECPHNKECGGPNDPCYYEIVVEYLGESLDWYNNTCLNFTKYRDHIPSCFTIDRFDVGQVETLKKLNPKPGHKLRMHDFGQIFTMVDLDGEKVFPDIITCDGIHVGANILVKLGEECVVEYMFSDSRPGFKLLETNNYTSESWVNGCVDNTFFYTEQYDELKKAFDNAEIGVGHELNVTISGSKVEICKNEFVSALNRTDSDEWSKVWRDNELNNMKSETIQCEVQ